MSLPIFLSFSCSWLYKQYVFLYIYNFNMQKQNFKMLKIRCHAFSQMCQSQTVPPCLQCFCCVNLVEVITYMEGCFHFWKCNINKDMLKLKIIPKSHLQWLHQFLSYGMYHNFNQFFLFEYIFASNYAIIKMCTDTHTYTHISAMYISVYILVCVAN